MSPRYRANTGIDIGLKETDDPDVTTSEKHFEPGDIIEDGVLDESQREGLLAAGAITEVDAQGNPVGEQPEQPVAAPPPAPPEPETQRTESPDVEPAGANETAPDSEEVESRDQRRRR